MAFAGRAPDLEWLHVGNRLALAEILACCACRVIVAVRRQARRRRLSRSRSHGHEVAVTLPEAERTGERLISIR